MSQPPLPNQYRILIIDDNPSIHEDFRKILGAPIAAEARLDDIEAALFGHAPVASGRTGFRIDSAYQGQEALGLIEKALQEGDPYTMAFVDVRMPPGWDGVETLERIWKYAPELQAVICTAYSDYSWDDITRRVGQTDNLLILKKPFETVEVLQLAHALTQKWTLGRQARLRMDDLDRMVRQRTEELLAANGQLELEVDERTRVQEALRVSEERFSKAFQASPIPMAILRCDDRQFLDANHSFIQLSGYSIEQLLQNTDQQLNLWTKGEEPGAGAFSPGDRLRDQACRFRRSDGSARQTMLSAEPLRIGATQCLLLIVEDITDQLKLEAQLRQSQKMEVIGRMAAGIAHEFNNILTVIQGDVGLLQAADAHAVDSRALLDQIMLASRRAATLTSQLLAFSRKQVLQPRRMNLSALVQRMHSMLARLIGEKYQIELQCPGDLPCLLADEGGLEQVLINLVLNARDAMSAGGIIQIQTSVAVVDEVAVAGRPDARPGRFACLTVTDHGCGMNAHVMARIFDPFFTTKDVGKGTGLGLSMIHGIVKQHDGWIDVASEVDRGSTFKIYLPLSAAADEPAITCVETHSATTALPELGKGETVFVVEDETAVRELACIALKKRGYQVLNAVDGPEALRMWDDYPANIDLLLTDMVMPSGMTGGELARTLQARQPGLKVLFTSGYSPEIMRENSLSTKGASFLPKPYDVQTLLRSVRLCLDGGSLALNGTWSQQEEAIVAG